MFFLILLRKTNMSRFYWKTFKVLMRRKRRKSNIGTGIITYFMIFLTPYREDRDKHIEIRWENIQNGMADQFGRYCIIRIQLP